MSKFYKTKEFKQLEKEWADKLKSSGFEDIEYDEDHLKQSSSMFKNQHTFEEFKAKQQYYELAERFFLEYDFTLLIRYKTRHNSKKELSFYKKIWSRHSKGMTAVDIAYKLDETYRRVQWGIDKLEKLMFAFYGVSSHGKI
jgi:hypothetical protein